MHRDSESIYSKNNFLKFTALFFTIYSTIFVTVPPVRNYESSAWRMIIDRLLANEIYGAKSFGEFLLIFSENSKKFVNLKFYDLGNVNNRDMFSLDSSNLTTPEVYTSQFGLIGNVGTFLQQSFAMPPEYFYLIMSGLTILVSSIMAAMLCLTLWELFGKRASYVSAFLMVSPWPILFSANFYYSMSFNLIFLFLPRVTLLALDKYNLARYRDLSITVVISFVTLIFSLTNYTYVSVWVACSVLGILLITDRGPIPVSTFVKVVCGQLVAVCIAIGMHLFKLNAYMSGPKNQNWLTYILKNKIGVANSNVAPEYLESASKSPLQVIDYYLKESLLSPLIQGRISGFGWLFTGYTTLALVILSSIYLIRTRKVGSNRARNSIKLIQAALIGPVSWLLLMRPHSWDNIQVNYIFMFLPLIPLTAGTLIGFTSPNPLKVDRLHLGAIHKFAIPYFGGLVVASYLIFYLL